jgi:hypothetical protein
VCFLRNKKWILCLLVESGLQRVNILKLNAIQVFHVLRDTQDRNSEVLTRQSDCKHTCSSHVHL